MSKCAVVLGFDGAVRVGQAETLTVAPAPSPRLTQPPRRQRQSRSPSRPSLNQKGKKKTEKKKAPYVETALHATL